MIETAPAQMAKSEHGFSLNPSIDIDAIAQAFARDGRVQISDFLDPASAQALADHLLARSDWRQVINSGERAYESDPAQLATMTEDQRARLQAAIYASARTGFQYRFNNIRVPDDDGARSANGTLLDQFAQFMGSPAMLSFFRRITGAEDIIHADAQGTIYRAGDFLTGHSDDTPGTHRRAAYILGLTQNWRTEWGGLLLFHAKDGGQVIGFTPAFNSITLFAVPQIHSVSHVAPWVEEPRLSVTGWLRAGRDGD